jgi:hypothetical protein
MIIKLAKESLMKTRFVALFVLFGLLALCSPMFAHHGAAAYDESKEVVLKGATVTKFAWANPHSIIQFDVKDDNGKVVHWAGELGSPSAITLQGWTKVSVQPGDVISIYIHQSKTGNPVGRISHVVLADGTQLHDSAGTSGGGRGGARDGSNY